MSDATTLQIETLSLAAAADLLRVSQATLQEWLDEGADLPTLSVAPGAYRFSRAELLAWLLRGGD